MAALCSIAYVALAIFIPVFGIFVTGIGLALETLAALLGDRVLSTASVILGTVSTFLLSPLLLIALHQNPSLFVFVFAFLAAPFAGIVIDAARKRSGSG
jgi:hypothetical protein